MTAVTVKRFDIGELKNVETTQQGYLKAPVYATRTGVFVYRKADGSTIRELRHPDEIFNPKSLATLKSVPLTNEHPPELLTPENTKQYIVGVTGEDVGTEDNFVTAIATIMDKQAIDDVNNGKKEVSCGYVCELDESPGEWEGEPYDVIQRNPVYNHLALVTRGRAGPDVKLRIDSADAVQCESMPAKDSNDIGNSAVSDKPSKGANVMEKITIGGKEYEVSPEVAAEFKALQAKVSSMQSDADAMMKTCDGQKVAAEQAAAKMDSLKVELEKAKASKNDGVDFMTQFKARKAIEKVAEKTLAADVVEKLDSMNEKEIKMAVIKAEHADCDLNGKSDAYIDARFDCIVETVNKDGASDLGKKINETRKDSKGGDAPDPEAARKRAMERACNQWKQA
jgi:hypothetical protein